MRTNEQEHKIDANDEQRLKSSRFSSFVYIIANRRTRVAYEKTDARQIPAPRACTALEEEK